MEQKADIAVKEQVSHFVSKKLGVEETKNQYPFSCLR